MPTVFARQHSCFRFVGRTSLLEIEVHLCTIALWAHVRLCRKDTLTLIRIFDDFILALLSLGRRLCFGEVNLFSIHFHFDVGRSGITAFVIGAFDVTRGTWKRQSPAFRAKHVVAINILHLIMVVVQ